MTLLRVDRSPVRLFLFGLAGLLLMLAAVDVMWGHWISTAPDIYNDAITSKGMNQRRSDYVWGMFMLAGGGALFGYAVTTLIRRKPVLVLSEGGIDLALGSPFDEPVFVSWEAIDFVSCAADTDPDGGSVRDVLFVDFNDRDGLPSDPWGAEWRGDRLVIDAVGWERPIEEVVLHASTALEHARRFSEEETPDD
ncbi:MAG: hypothetical protein ABFS21_04565 [Actinomycetota bacterium]